MYENFPDLKVLNFFDITINCYKLSTKIKLLNKKYLLNSFSYLLDEEEFAKVYMAWSEKGLFFIFDVKSAFIKTTSDYKKSDNVEIFVDTRSLKTKGYITKFCHHFVFFPQEIKGLKGIEVTRFALDDMHKLCEPKTLFVESIIKPKSYMLTIEIPSFCLVGFNPLQINYLSFAYRINRYEKPPQNFSISPLEHKIEKSPHLWPKVNLM
jgi:hypothetical protein